MTARRTFVATALSGLLLVLLVASAGASAKSLKGLSFADEAKEGGHTLVLNGLGVREATVFKVDVYVAGLYVKERSSDAGALLESGGPWRLDLKFLRDVEKAKLTEAWDEGFAKTAKGKDAASRTKLNGLMEDVKEGDVLSFVYLPDQGVEVRVKGKKRGTIPGAGFAKAFLAIWLGKDPPNPGLKTGLLGK